MNGFTHGDEITSTSNDREKFATYTRDSYTGLDYANQRYYASTYGRFNTVDPEGKSAILTNPLSWNRYTYTLGDPVNGSDPTGLCDDGDAMVNGDYDYSIGDGACPVLSIDDSSPDAGANYAASSGASATFNVTVTAKAPTGGFWSWLGGLFSTASQGSSQGLGGSQGQTSQPSPIPNSPDYSQLCVTAGEAVQGGVCVSKNLQDGTVYWGPTLSFGFGLPPFVSLSAINGRLNQTAAPTAGQINSWLSGFSGSVTGGAGVIGSIQLSNGSQGIQNSVETGVGTPQVGFSFGWNFCISGPGCVNP